MFILLGSSEGWKYLAAPDVMPIVLTLPNTKNGCGIASLGNFYGKKQRYIWDVSNRTRLKITQTLNHRKQLLRLIRIFTYFSPVLHFI